MAENAARASRNWRHFAAVGVLIGTFFLLYWPVITVMVRDWSDDNYSHGYVIVPLALYFAWERRRRLRDVPVRPSVSGGVLLVVVSLFLLFGGVLGAETFPARLSIVTMVGAAILLLLGWEHLKVLLFPLGFLLLMIPIPKLVFNEVAFPLQLLASQAATGGLTLLGIPVLREGNVIVLANTSLEVAEACSGIRSLMTLVTLSLVYGYFMDPRLSIRTLFVLMSIPIAIAANALRVTGTGVAAHRWGAAAAEGFFHQFSGWVVFIAALAMLLLLQQLVVLLFPRKRQALSVEPQRQ